MPTMAEGAETLGAAEDEDGGATGRDTRGPEPEGAGGSDATGMEEEVTVAGGWEESMSAR